MDSAPINCPEPWSTAVLEGGDSPMGEAQECECNCIVSDFECAGSLTVFLHSSINMCTTTVANHSIPTTGGCAADGGGRAINSFVSSSVPASNVVCQTDPVTLPLEDWTWSLSATACSVPNTLAECDGGLLCAPETPGGFHLCVHQDGDTECPSEYPDKRLIYTEVADTRTCNCALCSAPTMGSCGVEVSLYSDVDCTGLLGSSTQPTSCPGTSSPNTDVASMRAVLDGTTTATCGQSMASSSGDVTATSPHTVCCQGP